MSDPTVQSPTGPPEGATGLWHVSLTEIDAMGRKAARGAGFSWGMAEEAGRAARWLSAWRLPGPETLLAALEALDGAVARYAPSPDGPIWQADAGVLCPIAAGAALCDRAGALARGSAVCLGPVIAPALMVPPLFWAARDLGVTIGLHGGGIALFATPEGPAVQDWAPLLARTTAGEVRVACADAAPYRPVGPRCDAWPVPVETWRALERFAARTYAPATEASRRLGAGAGVIDTD